MENGNEKQNIVDNHTGSDEGKQHVQWRIVCGSDQRFYFVNSETRESQWLPPTDIWSSKLGLPYGWEVGITENNVKYYINHVKESTTLEDPRSEADQAIQLRMAAQRSRKVQISRDSSMGFGFVAGSERPVVIRSVIQDGPSYGILFSNDQILRVNGEDVSDVPQEKVINLIKSCVERLEMHVVSSEDLQDAKNQGPRRSSLMSRATRERRRSSPVNVRFADDIVQYIGPAEQARRGSFPALPNVLKVFLENGQTRSFHYNPRTIVQEIFISLGQKLGIKSMQYFSLVLSGPQKNQLSLVQNHEKVAEIYLNRNCSRSSWVCKLRLCFLPRNPVELFEEDPITFNYLYDQISKDIVEGHYESDLRYDLAIKLAALHMQQKATESKNKMPSKISVKTVEKDFDGLQHFIPENIINGVKLKDLRKVLDQQIKFNQSLATIGQKYISSIECKKRYLKEATDLMSYGGKYFNVIMCSNDGKANGTAINQSVKKPKQQEASLLVSPRYGLSQMVKGKVNVLCQVADLEQITEFSIGYHTEGKRLLTISVNENKDTVLIMKPLDSMDLVTFIVGYQKLWKRQPAKLKILGDTKEPLAPLTDNDIPPYQAVHRIIPDSWSYPSLLQVPGNHSEHNFFVDLSKRPFDIYKSTNEATLTNDIGDSSAALKRPSEEAISGENEESENDSSDIPEKRLRSAGNDSEGGCDVNDEKSRTLYMITEEGYLSNNDEEAADDDYITQLAFAEEIWREQREQEHSSANEHDVDSDDRTLNTMKSKQNTEEEDKASAISEDNDVIDEEDIDSNEGYSAVVHRENTPIINGERYLQSIDKISEHLQDQGTSEMQDSLNEQDKLDEPTQFEDKLMTNHDEEHIATVHDTDDQLDQREEIDFLDINDIDIDDRCIDGSAGGSHTSLADFSFAGELFTPEHKSSTESLDNDHDVTNVETLPMYNDSKVSENSLEDETNNTSVDQINGSPNPPYMQAERKYFAKVLHVDELDNKVLSDRKSPEKNVPLESDKSTNDDRDKGRRMLVYDINIEDSDHSSNEEEAGIRLLSFKQRGDNSDEESPYPTYDNIINVDGRKKPTENVHGTIIGKKTNDCIEHDQEDIKSNEAQYITTEMDKDEKDNGAGKAESWDSDEGKDSDLSSLTSYGSNIGDSNETHEGKVTANTEQDDLYVLAPSNTATLDETKMCDSTPSTAKKDLDKPESENAVKDVDIASLPDSSDHVREESDDFKPNVEFLRISTNSDPKLTDQSSAPRSLVLGADPGESDDTPLNVIEASFTDDCGTEFIDDKDMSLMEWIIPPPPMSTQELQDSDITIASPPPQSPSRDYICSPPVELCEKMFDELEIVGLIVPPPPLGSLDELNMVKQNASSRVVRENVEVSTAKNVKNSIHKLDNPSLNELQQDGQVKVNGNSNVDNTRNLDTSSLNGNYRDQEDQVNKTKDVEHELEKLSLDDDWPDQQDQVNSAKEYERKLENLSALNDDHHHVEIVTLPERPRARRVHSSESSSSQPFDCDSDSANYNSESMISCYSLSNDSQRSSEDEIFEEESRLKLQQSLLQRNLNRKGHGYASYKGNDNREDSDDASILSLKQKTKHRKYRKAPTKSLANKALSMNHEENRSKEACNGLPFDGDDYDCLDDVIVEQNKFPSSHNNLKTARKSKPTEPPKPPRVIVGKQQSAANHFDRSSKHEDGVKESADLSAVNNEIKEFGKRDYHARSIPPISYTDNEAAVTVVNKKYHETSVSDIASSHIPAMDNILEEQVSSKDSSNANSNTFPDYLLQSSKPQAAPQDSIPVSEKSIQFESESNEERTSTLTRSHESDVRLSSFQPGLDDRSDVDDFDSVCSDQSQSFKQETKELTERLKLRIQGCVDDCAQAVLKSSYSPFSGSTKWRDSMQENATRFASDIKQLNTNVQGMNNDAILSSIKSSQESLQLLVSSFVMSSSAQGRNSLYNIRILAGMLNDVIDQYNDIIERTEESLQIYPEKRKCKDVATKTTRMNALIGSLSRKLKMV